MQRYEPIRGMLICKSGGDYVLLADVKKRDEQIIELIKSLKLLDNRINPIIKMLEE